MLSRKEYESLLKELETLKQELALLQKQLLTKEEEQAHLEAANARLQYQLNELKQKPFKPSKPKDKGSKPHKPKPKGRRKGHKGSGRKSPHGSIKPSASKQAAIAQSAGKHLAQQK